MNSTYRRTIWLAAAAVLLSLSAAWAVHYRQQRFNRLTAQCVAAFHAKNWTMLESLARELTDRRHDPGSQYWLGISLKEQRLFDAAYQAFDSVPLDGPRGIDAAVERMEIQFHVLQHPLEAVELAEKLLRIDRKLASPRRHLIYFHAMMLHRPEVLLNTHLAIEDHVDLPDHYVYLVTLEDLNFRDAEEVTAKWANACPDCPELTHLYLARRVRSARAGMLTSPTDEAREHYAALRAEIEPQLRDWLPEVIALDTLLLLAVDDENVPEVGRLLALVPDTAAGDPVFWRYRGWYAVRSGDLEQAEQSYREALEIHPLGWQTRAEYANVLRLRARGVDAAAAASVSTKGSELVADIRRLPHAQDIDSVLLKRMANYAISCKATEIANGILRRQKTSAR